MAGALFHIVFFVVEVTIAVFLIVYASTAISQRTPGTPVPDGVTWRLVLAALLLFLALTHILAVPA